MSSDDVLSVPDAWAARAHVTASGAETLREQARRDPDGFWRRIGARLDWVEPPTRIKDVSYDIEDFRIRWFKDGVLNACFNCVDRHLPQRAEQTAILWEGDEGETARLTYGELHAEVCRMANVLKHLGVRRGDRVTVYLPMIPLAAVTLLACARIGAVHSVVFAGFSAEALAGRIADCGSRVVVTADEGRRGGKRVPLKANVDAAIDKAPGVVERVLTIRATGADVPMTEGRDVLYDAVRETASTDCPCEAMGAEDPLFILYTSGSTGKPKGLLHTTGGYLAWASWTHEVVFDHRPGEIYWCAADIGWVTGHSYIVYGPLANGATTLMFEGVPTWPDAGRLWEVVDKHQVEILYTAPTAIRALMREGNGPVSRSSRRSLRLLGSVGEPINPEAWLWYWRVVGEGRCPIVDTWWQTETGGILISPLPGATALKPGSATRPLPGVEPALVDADGTLLEGEASGNLVLLDGWPGQARTIWGDHERFLQTYFTTYPGRYFTGDGCRRDADGDYWITGRVDDVINVSGHRIGTAEVESALVGHAGVTEAAVVGYPHEIKGQGLYCYVTLAEGIEASDGLKRELVGWVRREIGPFAAPDVIQWAPGLPKTRSGKIMRRILRKIAEGDVSNLGDTSTLADPAVVDDLLAARGA